VLGGFFYAQNPIKKIKKIKISIFIPPSAGGLFYTQNPNKNLDFYPVQTH